MSKILKTHTYVKFTGQAALTIAGLPFLANNVQRIWAPSASGASKVSAGFNTSNVWGGTLTQFTPPDANGDGGGYWIQAKALNWDLPAYLAKVAETNTAPESTSTAPVFAVATAIQEENLNLVTSDLVAKALKTNIQTLSGSAPTWNADDDTARITLSANTTINLSNYSEKVGRLHVKQNGTGNFTLTIVAGGVTQLLSISKDPNTATLVGFSNDGDTTLFQTNFGTTTAGTGTSDPGTFINPPAPTDGIVDNDANLFKFTPAAGYTSNQHEGSKDSGFTWTDIGTTPQLVVGDGDFESGVVQIRVKAGSGRNAGAKLVNSVPFTGGLPGTIDWGTLTNITASDAGRTLSKTGGVNFTYGDNSAFSAGAIPLGSYIQCTLGSPVSGYGLDFGFVAKLADYADTELRFVRITSSNSNDGYGEVGMWNGAALTDRQFWHAGAMLRVEHRSNGTMFFRVKEADSANWVEWSLEIANANTPWFAWVRFSSPGNVATNIHKGTIVL